MAKPQPGQNPDAALEQAVQEYMSLEADLKYNRDLKASLTLDPFPDCVTSIEEAARLADLLNDNQVKRENLDRAYDTLRKQHKEREAAIIGMLPLPNLWVKVREVAVGKYYSTWGGGHMDLSIVNWSDNLGRLQDRTYFP